MKHQGLKTVGTELQAGVPDWDFEVSVESPEYIPRQPALEAPFKGKFPGWQGDPNDAWVEPEFNFDSILAKDKRCSTILAGSLALFFPCLDLVRPGCAGTVTRWHTCMVADACHTTCMCVTICTQCVVTLVIIGARQIPKHWCRSFSQTVS